MTVVCLILAKEGLELLGDSQMKFSNMVSEVGLAAAMRPKTEYTILAPVNTAFSSELFPKQILCSDKKKKKEFIFCLHCCKICQLLQLV